MPRPCSWSTPGAVMYPSNDIEMSAITLLMVTPSGSGLRRGSVQVHNGGAGRERRGEPDCALRIDAQCVTRCRFAGGHVEPFDLVGAGWQVDGERSAVAVRLQ